MPFKSWGFVSYFNVFLKEVSSSYQGCICLIQNSNIVKYYYNSKTFLQF